MQSTEWIDWSSEQVWTIKAKSFTLEDGDLSTKEGQDNLLTWIVLFQPRHIWLSPECSPWSAWNKFNSHRSLQSFARVRENQEDSRVRLRFCQFICQIHTEAGRHAHMEKPWTAELWNQGKISEFVRLSVAAKLDQCMFGLRRHPAASLYPYRRKLGSKQLLERCLPS